MMKTRRLSLDITPEVYALLEKVRDDSKSTTLVEAFRRSLHWHELTLAHIANGGKVIFEDTKGKQETIKLL